MYGGVDMHRVEFKNESRDTVRIDSLLMLAHKAESSGDAVAMLGMSLVGTPYVAHTLEGDEELLRVNMEELDCTTFVETVVALALTRREGRDSWRDFLSNLERVRYRGGEMNGYPSRLHYICNWIVDNSYRGNLVEVTGRFDGVRQCVKSIDFMSRNRGRYAQLADSATFEAIRAVESGFRNHKYPYLPTGALGGKAAKNTFRNGDIVALTSKLPNLDVTHMGIIVIKDGEPYLLHASSSLKKVTVTEVPLSVFMERNRNLTGVRVMRITD